MRSALLLVGLALAAPTISQSPLPLPGFGNTFTSSLTRGFWFQAPIPFVIIGIEVHNEPANPNQVVEVIDLLGAPPPAYPGTVNGTQLFYNNLTPTGPTMGNSGIIPCAIPVAPGQYIGILGATTTTTTSSTSYNSYATPSGAFSSSVFGNPMSLTRFGTQSGIASNGGNQPCWQEVSGPIARVDLHIVPASGFASKTVFGTGCNMPTPLSIDGSGRPVLGTTITLDTTNVPSGSPIGSTLYGFTEFPAGISLSGIGMPGCFQYITGDASLLFFPTTSSVSSNFVVPNAAWLSGVQISVQSAALSAAANATGVVTSNGLRLIMDVN